MFIPLIGSDVILSDTALRPRRLGAALRAVLLLLGMHGGTADALPSDRDKPIQIQADWAELDERKGTATYGGDVRMTQGTMQVRAERLVIYTERDKVLRILADGSATSPARYEQQPREDQPVLQASAQHIIYVAAEQRIELRGSARLSQKNNQFTGGVIEYSIARELVTANSGQSTGGRVTVTFDPNQRR